MSLLLKSDAPQARFFCHNFIFDMNCPLDRTFFTIKQNKKSPVALQFILRNQSTITTILMLICSTINQSIDITTHALRSSKRPRPQVDLETFCPSVPIKVNKQKWLSESKAAWDQLRARKCQNRCTKKTPQVGREMIKR